MKAKFMSKVLGLNVPIDPGKTEIISTTTGNVKRVRQPKIAQFVNGELITEDEDTITILRYKKLKGIGGRYEEVPTDEKLEVIREKAERKRLMEKFHVCPVCKWMPPDDSKNPGASLNMHTKAKHPEYWEKMRLERKDETLTK